MKKVRLLIVSTFEAMALISQQPTIHALKQLKLPVYETIHLTNGMPVYILEGGNEPVMKLEVVFRAGSYFETKPGASEIMAGLLSEGTTVMSSAILAEYIESRGATLQSVSGVDTVQVRLFTLNRFLPELMGVFSEIIQLPAFDPGELKVYSENKVERLKISLKKNEVLADRFLSEAIFGPEHPYGRNIRPEGYLSITENDLREHHRSHLLPDKAAVFISGSFGQKERETILSAFEQWKPVSAGQNLPSKHPESIAKTGLFEFKGPQTHQAAIRVGRKLFSQKHPDFNGLFLLNTILGGYFGSRLMNEIRENKGLTYGIYSSMDTYVEESCFYIGTETATGNVDKVIDAIKGETRKLQEELIPDDELNMAKNYLMGHLMTLLDGSFSSMDYVKTMKIERMGDTYFESLISSLLTISAEELRQLAIRYLDLEKWVTIVVK